MEIDKERICYNCQHVNLCVTRYYFDPLGGTAPHAVLACLNFERNSPDAPGTRTSIMVAVANCCTMFEPKPEEELR